LFSAWYSFIDKALSCAHARALRFLVHIRNFLSLTWQKGWKKAKSYNCVYYDITRRWLSKKLLYADILFTLHKRIVCAHSSLEIEENIGPVQKEFRTIMSLERHKWILNNIICINCLFCKYINYCRVIIAYNKIVFTILTLIEFNYCNFVLTIRELSKTHFRRQRQYEVMKLKRQYQVLSTRKLRTPVLYLLQTENFTIIKPLAEV